MYQWPSIGAEFTYVAITVFLTEAVQSLVVSICIFALGVFIAFFHIFCVLTGNGLP
jgi:hypothetical protein